MLCDKRRLCMKRLIAEEYKRFEDIKQIREDGSEF